MNARRLYFTCWWRRRPRKTSLRRRLVVINLIATGATFALIGVALIAGEYLAHSSVLLDDLQAGVGAINRTIDGRLAWYALVVGLAGIAGLGIAVWLIDRMLVTASRPLRQLIRLMKSASGEEKPNPPPSLRDEDEFGTLARGFDRMLKRIEDRERDLKRELTERRRTERRLARLAHYDMLTDLPNRYYFNGRLIDVLARARHAEQVVALLFIDLDNFKIVNDTLGHHAGDLLLKAVSARLRTCVRASDIVCRLGGDEFTVILGDIRTQEQAGRVAEKIVAGLSAPFRVLDLAVHVSCSVGISLYPKDGGDAAKLMKCGDMAMYHAKARGKNNFQFFTEELNARVLRRLTLETGLRRALERSELVLHYQPQIDLRTGEIVAAEALLRWNCAGAGIVEPREFISVAEETGLIVPIGEWVLWAACSQAGIWRRAGHRSLSVSVNVSGRQFREPGFVRAVANVLEGTGLDAPSLVLELTESVLLEDSESAIIKAQDLRAMGVRLAIDDFGTGYSSIGHLKRLPINEIKIDRSHVGGIPDDADDVGLARAIIAMAHGLNIEIVAQGVETLAQLKFLAAHNCTRAQGHIIARAMPIAQFDERLRKHGGGSPWLPRSARSRAEVG